MKKRVADIVMDILVENGITDCFMVVGGGAMNLNNALALRDDIHKVFNHHEQACAMAAEAYTKACGKLALVCVTSGPGALNTLTGVEGAWVDNTPMLVISGQTRYATSVESTGLPLRYRGVQEHEITKTVQTITKYAKKIYNPLEIKYELQKAIHVALSGRKGPVWIDIPLDVQSSIVEEKELDEYCAESEDALDLADGDIELIRQCFSKANRPCILTGSGLRSANAVEAFRLMVLKWKIPIVGGALQADILPLNFPNYFGMSGSVGPRAGNYILQNADLILVLGNSLSFKQTGFEQAQFAPNAQIIMVDVDKNEAKKPGLHVDISITADLYNFCNKMMDCHLKLDASKEWLSYCGKVYSRFPAIEFDEQYCSKEGVSQYEFWQEFYKQSGEDSAIALGNSNCVVGCLQKGIRYDEQRVIVNYNCGSMGDDLPEAIGVCIALKKPVYCVTGDGSVMMNLQELQTIVHNDFPIRIVIFSNDGYGAIRQTNKNFFNGLYLGCDKESGVSFPEMKKVAEAFGFLYNVCEKKEELAESIKWLNGQKKYAILEMKQKITDPVLPKVMSKMLPDNSFYTPALHDMYPFMEKEVVDEYMLQGKKGR